MNQSAVHPIHTDDDVDVQKTCCLADPCHDLVINLGNLRGDPANESERFYNRQRFVAYGDDWIAGEPRQSITILFKYSSSI